MSNDCEECKIILQQSKKRKSLNQMSDAERELYWETYRKLVETSSENDKE